MEHNGATCTDLSLTRDFFPALTSDLFWATHLCVSETVHLTTLLAAAITGSPRNAATSKPRRLTSALQGAAATLTRANKTARVNEEAVVVRVMAKELWWREQQGMSAHYNDSLSLEPKLHTDHESTMGRGSIGSGGDGRCHGGCWCEGGGMCCCGRLPTVLQNQS